MVPRVSSPKLSPFFTRLAQVSLSGALTLALSGCVSTGSGKVSPLSQEASRKADWQAFRRHLTVDYAYVNKARFDVTEWIDRHQKQALSAATTEQFIDLLQVIVRRFQDPHLNIGPYNHLDYSITPTGSDLWVSFEQGVARVIDVKMNGAAARAGVRPGWIVESVAGRAIKEAALQPFGKKLKPSEVDDKLLAWGANIVLGGLRHQSRDISFVTPAGTRTKLQLAATYAALPDKNSAPVDLLWQQGVPIIRFNNSLGKKETPQAFDEALKDCLKSPAIVLDLRNTPSGGNTTVARRIMGHFTPQEVPYQRHSVVREQVLYEVPHRSLALVSPLKPYYPGKVLVLAGRWTGSMGEGLVIGLDALGKSTIGSQMGRLLGAIHTVRLPHSEARLELPAEALFHVDGTPREDFIPRTALAPADTGEDGADPLLAEVLSQLEISKN